MLNLYHITLKLIVKDTATRGTPRHSDQAPGRHNGQADGE